MKELLLTLLSFIGFIFYYANEVNSADCSSYSSEPTCEGVPGCWWQSNQCLCSSNVTMDIAFALDASGSIGSNYFTIELNWLSEFVQSSLSNSARVGIIEFATTSAMILNFTDSQKYTSSSQLANFVTSITYTGGYTNTVAAIKQGIRLFEKESDDQRSKVLVIMTDGNPYLPGGDTDVCAWASTLKSDDITCIIIGVGDNWNPDNVDCLVQKDSDIIYVTSFNYNDFDAILPTLTEITCPVEYKAIVTEVKVQTETTVSDVRTGRFVEIYNPSSDIILSEIEFDGFVTGTAVSPVDQTTQLSQGSYLVLYDKTTSAANNVSCAECECTLMSNGFFCRDSLYIGCDGTYCTFDNSMTNSNWNVRVEDTNDGSDLDSVTYDAATWPSIVQGYSYELKSKGFDNSQGSNWAGSCNIYGTPGADPITDCNAICTTDQCTANGASDDQQVNGECRCSDADYYSDGCSCNLVPPPGDCIAYWRKNFTNNQRTVKFVWSRAQTDDDHYYELKYYTNQGSIDRAITYARTKVVADYQYTRGSDKIAGWVVTAIDYGNSGATAYSTQVNCTVVTQSPTSAPTEAPTDVPTPSPTESPTPSPTFENPRLYLGGDLCEQDRCECYGMSDTCVGPDLTKEFAENNDQIQYVTVEQRPTDFPYQTLVYWQITYIGATTQNDSDVSSSGTTSTTRRREMAMRRILSDKMGEEIHLDNLRSLQQSTPNSGVFATTTQLPVSGGGSGPSTTSINYGEGDIEPMSGYVNVSVSYSDTTQTSISGNNGKIGFVVKEESALSNTDSDYELFYLELINCSIDSSVYEDCFILYPDSLYIVIENSNSGSALTTTTEEEMPAWLWWVIVGLVIFLFVLGWLVYRYWWKNKQTSSALNETENDLEQAIEEADLGFGRDLAQGDVGYNPLAVGVPNASRPADAMGAELAARQQFAGNDKADVAVEKFQHKDEFGQVAPNRRGNDLAQPLL